MNLFEKIWQSHLVADVSAEESLLYVNRIFLHERTGGIALSSLKSSGRDIKNPDSVSCVIDHIVDTTVGRGDLGLVENSDLYIRTIRGLAREFGVRLFDIGMETQGISHVVAAEQGLAVPGSVVICPDSHTCTLGGVGALGIGVGTSQAELALATSVLAMKKPETLRIVIEGVLHEAASAKDIALAVIRRFGVSGGQGCAVEYAGSTVLNLGVEARMTLCNMSVEFGAFAGLVGCDDATAEYFFATPQGSKLSGSGCENYIASLRSDEDAVFGTELALDVEGLKPHISWGITPEQCIEIGEKIPELNESNRAAFDYMQLQEGGELSALEIDFAFIGSCTNSRLSDLIIVAEFLQGKKVFAEVKAIIVPGSSLVKKEAEKLGIDKIFHTAGFEWRESGCSLCFYAGGESFGEGARGLSSTNRNFQNRQGPGVKTHITSPLIVALGAVLGRIPDANDLSLIGKQTAAH